MNRTDRYAQLAEQFPDIIVRDEPLSRHTSFKIGGAADLFCAVSDVARLASLLQAARTAQIPHVLIGAGSNVLADDRGFRGLVIKLTGGAPPVIDFPLLRAHAGMQLAELLDFAAEHALNGFEFLAGIPGTVGGAVYMNAGAYGSSVSEIIHSAAIVEDGGGVVTVSPGYFRFGYRRSILQSRRDIVVSVAFTVKRGSREAITAEYNRIKAVRAQKHPDGGVPCAGSYFKNLPPEKPGERRRPAGAILEKAGAKSFRVGGAAVFHKHANMIINTGNATARDVLALAKKMKKTVYDRFAVRLEEEVRFLDAEKGIITTGKGEAER